MLRRILLVMVFAMSPANLLGLRAHRRHQRRQAESKL